MTFLTPALAIICILIIIFILICLECILRKRVSYFYEIFDQDEEAIELKIREIIGTNPDSEIIILCTPKNPDTITILDKLTSDFPQLHIIK